MEFLHEQDISNKSISTISDDVEDTDSVSTSFYLLYFQKYTKYGLKTIIKTWLHIIRSCHIFSHLANNSYIYSGILLPIDLSFCCFPPVSQLNPKLK